jgi:ATP-dependent Clp protease ATP-binding subunit ClpA
MNIQRELQDPLAVKILAGEFKDGETVLIDQVADGLSFSVAVGATEN